MGEVYHEHLIKKKITTTDILVRAFFVCLCLLPTPFLLNSTLMVYALLLIIAFVYLATYMFKQTDVEYEYLYLSGECQFDKICGRTKRKGCGKLEMDKVEIIAHEKAKELEPYEKQPYKLRDFSSHDTTAENRYVAFERKDSSLIKVIFEPSEAIIKEMKVASPRKVLLKGEQGYGY